VSEKIISIQKKLRRERWIKLFSPVVGAIMGLFIGSIFILSQGVNPLTAYYYLLQGSLLSVDALSANLLKTIPLALGGLAVVVSYKAKILNIGAEGQMYLGAIAATVVGINFEGLPPILHVSFAILAGAFFGGLFAVIPGYLKAYKGINEIVVTMLLNYVAFFFLSLLVQGPLREPGTFYPRSVRLFSSSWLPFIPGTYLHTGIFIVITLAIAMFWMFKKTTVGFRIEAAGHNPRALEYAGVNVKFLLTRVMIGSGMLAGVAGAIEILGVHRRLIEAFSVGLGYDSIAVALMANLNPLGVLLSAAFFGGLKAGANTMQIFTGIPVFFVYIIQATVIFFVVMFQSAPYIVQMIKKRI
jgi:general nucleoside transport system permease protein